MEGRKQKFRQWVGRTTQNRVLNFTDPAGLAGDRNLVGSYCLAQVTASGPNSLVGELAAAEFAPAFQGLHVLN